MTTGQEEMLKMLLQGVQSPQPYLGIALTVALSY